MTKNFTFLTVLGLEWIWPAGPSLLPSQPYLAPLILFRACVNCC